MMIFLDKDVIARFWSKVNVLKKRQCWEWQSSVAPNGYGKISIKNYPYSSHVIAYRIYYGEYAKELHIDHVCRNRKCVNPNHLRAVTPQINAIENSNSMASRNFSKIACSNGHPFTAKNTVIKTRYGKPYRKCRTCLSMDCQKAKEKRQHLDKHRQEKK